MSWNIFRRHPKKFLGIDIGTSSIRVVEVGKKGQTLQLENYGEIKTPFIKKRPFRIFEKNILSLSERDTAQAIRSINLEAGIQTKDANFSVPDFCSFFTTLELPSMSKEKIFQAIRYQIRPYIPLPLSEVTLDWTITEGEISKTPLKVLVVAIPNHDIEQYKTIAHFANLTLRFLEPEVFALARSSIKDKLGEKIIALIDMGARSTTCSIVEKRIVKISHSFNIGGNDLTEVIAESLNIGYNKAEEMKRRYGLAFVNGEQEEASKDIKKVLTPLVDSVLEEVKRTFRDFYRVEGKEVEKIVLAGGVMLSSGLKEYFSTGLKKEVVITKPFSNILYPSILRQTLMKLGPSYAISVGLASKGFQ